MSERTEKKIVQKIDSLLAKSKKKVMQNGFKKDKVVNEVLDKTTMMTLYNMINSGTLSYVNGVVRSGKESVLFWATDRRGKDIALKVYLVTTSNFKKRASYLIGDPRFSHLKKGTRNIVETWARKEFRNLKQCVESGIPCVVPIEIVRNVLAMEFLGSKGIPARTLTESKVDYKDYRNTISIISGLYRKAKLVHADFSEYNIFKTEKGLIVFDLASAVDIRHPNAKEFLERDINNISRFFVKRGLTVENPSDVLARITK